MPEQTTEIPEAIMRECEAALDAMGGWQEHHDLGAITEAVAPILTAPLREELEEVRKLAGGMHNESALQAVRGLKDLREAAMKQYLEQVDARREEEARADSWQHYYRAVAQDFRELPPAAFGDDQPSTGGGTK